MNEGLSRITPEIVSRVVSLLNWQLEIRRELDPIDAENKIASMEEAVRRSVKAEIPKRDLQRKVNYQRAGLFVFNTAISNLIRAKEIGFNPKKQIYFPLG